MTIYGGASDLQRPGKVRASGSLRRFDSLELFAASSEDGYFQLATEQPLGIVKCFTSSLSGGGAPGDELCEPREVVTPAIYWYRLSEVLINFPLHVMWTKDGQRLSDLSIYSNELPSHLSSQTEVAVRGEYYIVTNNNFANYAHWMTECLPGLYAAQRLNIPSDSVLLPLLNLPFHRPSSHTLGADIQRSPSINAANLRIQKLNFLSYADHSRPRHVTWPADLVEISGKLRTWCTRAIINPYYERLYISRSTAGRRRCENEATFEEQVSKLGFAVITLEQLPLDQQIYLFARASVVVAFHGAALANVMFCKQAALVIEIQPAAVRSSHFLRISHQFNLRYSIFRQSGSWEENPHSPWTLDIKGALDFIHMSIDKAGL